ncbi:MAG: hypothetical protein WA152_03010 [Microgenomates group bacterium]
MLNKLLITKGTSPEEIAKYISTLREQKGKEKEVLVLINEALSFGHEFIVSMFFEEALTNQHLYMNDSSNKKALIDMQNSVLKAGFYINKYNLTRWQSRYFRFLGRIEDYKKNFKKSSFYYKKSIKYIKSDPEQFRIFELEGFLAFAILMSGQIDKGYKYSKKVYSKYVNTKNGILLKKKDYFTWAVWRSGVAIRTINALIDNKANFKLIEIKKWLDEVETELNVKGYDFSYRKSELLDLKEKLKLN